MRAVIFDMDGVLVNSIRAHYRSFRKLFSEMGINYSLKEFLEHDITAGTMNVIPRVLKEHNKKGNVKLLRKRKNYLVKDSRIPLFAGVLPLIKQLHMEGFKLAVASGGTKPFVRLMIRKHKLNKYFPVVVTGEDKVRQKPNPDIFLKAAWKLKMNPRECLVIEDSHNGVAAAKRAGMKVIGHKVKLEKQDLKRADAIVGSMTQVNMRLIKALLRPNVKIRKFKREDAKEVAKMYRNVVRFVNCRHYKKKHIHVWLSTATVKTFWKKEKGSNRYVATINGKIVGVGEFMKDGDFRRLYVHKDHQGEGIGTALLRRIEKDAHKKGIKHLCLGSSITGKTFYQKHGYKFLKNDLLDIRGHKLPMRKMKKKLK